MSKRKLPVLQPLSVRIATALDSFKRDGFAIIPQVFNEDETDLVRQEAYVHANSKARVQKVVDFDGNERPSLLFWPQDISPILKMVAHDPRMKEIVYEFLGGDVFHINNQIYYREAGDGDEFAWHQDICFRTPKEDFADVENNYVQTVIAVDDITLDNSPVEFILGSHKFGDLGLIPRDNSERGLRRFQRRNLEGHKALAKSGDVLLWNLLIIHGSEKNRSLSNRQTFMNGFARESAVLNKTRFPTYMKDGK